MTELLERAIARLKTLPASDQDAIALPTLQDLRSLRRSRDTWGSGKLGKVPLWVLSDSHPVFHTRIRGNTRCPTHSQRP